MRRDRTLRVALAAAAGLGLWFAWAQNPPQQLNLQKVTDNLYVIIGDGGNSAFLPTSEGVILVDDKFAADAPQIVAKVKSITDQPIRYVLNTHQHGDHTGGNQALMAANAEIVIHKNARANMVANKQPGLPQITFTDESQVFLGGKEVVARHLGRGHTNGDAVVYFPSERVLHTGDLFVVGAPYCDTNNGGSIKDWDQTVKKILATYDFDTVIPGHGPVSKRADLEKWVSTMATVRDRVRSACAAGAASAADKLDFSGLGFQPSTLFKSGVPGMCKELAE